MDKNGRNKLNKECSVCKSILGTCCYKGLLLCSRHQTQIKRKGQIVKRTRKDQQLIKKYKDYCIMDLYDRKQNVIAKTKFDKEDLKKVLKYRWVFHYNYVSRTHIKDKKHLFLHRFLLDYYGKKDIDHINNNPLDNRKKNLRIVSRNFNNINRKISVGVLWYKPYKKWRARIGINNKSKTLGYFKTKKEAQNARKEAEISFYNFLRIK